jgi:hypothetical protein
MSLFTPFSPSKTEPAKLDTASDPELDEDEMSWDLGSGLPLVGDIKIDFQTSQVIGKVPSHYLLIKSRTQDFSPFGSILGL